MLIAGYLVYKFLVYSLLELITVILYICLEIYITEGIAV